MSWELYKIKKGNHYSRHLPKFCTGNRSCQLNNKVIFTESCLYDSSNLNYKDDINKLFGYSHGYHKKDSVRFGWERTENERFINIHSYIYTKGERKTKFLAKVELYKPYMMTIHEKIYDDYITYNFHIHDMNPVGLNVEYFTLCEMPKIMFGYYLFPYFGGDEVAQHDTKIYIG